MGVHHTTTHKRWAVCDRCLDRKDGLREDLIPEEWAKVRVEPAPAKYPDSFDMADNRFTPKGLGPLTWDRLIRPDLNLALCAECHSDFIEFMENEE